MNESRTARAPEDQQRNVANSTFLAIRNEGFGWFKSRLGDGEVNAKGSIHAPDGRAFADQSLAEYFAEAVRRDALEEAISSANGAFAVVVVRERQTFAAVDDVRSMPIFYAVEDGSLLLSDDADAIKARLADARQDSASMHELILCGYAVGPHTVIQAIKQIQAGERLEWAGNCVSLKRYYTHLHGPDYSQATKQENYERLGAISQRIAQRLIESLQGRPVILPLSGGYDSRYIACMLYEAGFRNVVTYTYGRSSSHEVSISRAVAERLDYPWHFVEYTEPLILDTLRNDFEWQRYCWYCHNLSSLPHIQEYIALRELHAKGVLPSDGVVVPGFCGDVLGGSYIPLELKSGNETALLQQDIADYVAHRHMANRLFYDEGVSPQSLERIRTDLAGYGVEANSPEAYVSLNEAWFTGQKLAKFVVNSLRVYEFFGHAWRMPLWDRELTTFWYQIPLADRIHKKLYDEFLFGRYFEPHKVDYRKDSSSRFLRLHGILTRLGVSESRALSIASQLKKEYARFRVPAPHFNAFDIFSAHYLRDMPDLANKRIPMPHVNGIYARWFIERHYSSRKCVG